MKYYRSLTPNPHFIVEIEDTEKSPEGYYEITETEFNELHKNNCKSGGWYGRTIEERNTKDILFAYMLYKPLNDDLTADPDFDRPLIVWNEENITCDRCSELMLFYLGDEDDTYAELAELKKTAKEYIRSLFADKEKIE